MLDSINLVCLIFLLQLKNTLPESCAALRANFLQNREATRKRSAPKLGQRTRRQRKIREKRKNWLIRPAISREHDNAEYLGTDGEARKDRGPQRLVSTASGDFPGKEPFGSLREHARGG